MRRRIKRLLTLGEETAVQLLNPSRCCHEEMYFILDHIVDPAKQLHSIC